MAQVASSDNVAGHSNDVPADAAGVSLLPSYPPSSSEQVTSPESTPRSAIRDADSYSASTSYASSTAPSFLSRKMDHITVTPRRLSYDLLIEITDGFSEERIIGSGGYGKVYKGVHRDGETIAVKILYDMPALDDEQFKMEFNNLICLRHSNIVRLVGYCHETRQECVQYNGRLVVADKIYRALCFEYVQNGSLQENISDEYNGHHWRECYNIIKGICNGLSYLHQELKPPMYHLDLKPANVLLDEKLLPKIADFGLSRLFGQEQTKITKSSIGTCGYLPPEYIEQNVISNKFDIFSLGVIIIKVMAGPAGYSKYADMPSREFVKLVQGNWRAKLQASSIGQPWLEAYYEQVKTCIEIALRCVDANRHKRPSIKDIVDKMNETETKILLCSPLQLSSKFESVASAITGLTRFKYSDLASATERFSSTIAAGVLSIVYKGSYRDQNGKEEFAVKRILHTQGEAWDLLIYELQILSRMRHMNLVRLKGWCSRRNLIDSVGWSRKQNVELFFVYELVPNGTLHEHLHEREKILPWEERYQIVKGIGSALHYLHHEYSEIILHRDIKAKNILLDYDFKPKLLMQRSIGSLRYLMKRGKCEFNRKTDVYSFGIVLLEIACTDKSREQVWELYRRSAEEPRVIFDAADRNLCGVFDRTQMEQVIALGLKCSERDSELRPYMRDVMEFLEEGTDLLHLNYKL